MISKVTIAGGGGNNFTLERRRIHGFGERWPPEPGTIAMLMGGLGCLAFFDRRKRIS